MIRPEPITQSDHKTADEPRSGDAVRSAGAALLATARARNAGMWEKPSQPGGARRRGDQSRRPPGGDVRGELVASEWGADFSSPRVSTCSVDGDTRSMPARAGRGGAGVCEAWAPLVTPL